ncbi:macro domain-containing protein, partial [Kitasatospora sp. NPDC091257]|uniref:macro domain-containing protein n=1 Tax=Kitasatospora sp. NPDC091257 TaxID=3364084 RepID=UPI0037F5CEB8
VSAGIYGWPPADAARIALGTVAEVLGGGDVEEYEERAELLASCYRESLRTAVALGARTVAFPAVSAGIYGWPPADAARIALGTVAEVLGGGDVEAGAELAEVRFVLFGSEMYGVFERARRELPERGA